MWVLGAQMQIFCLQGKHLRNRAITLDLKISFKYCICSTVELVLVENNMGLITAKARSTAHRSRGEAEESHPLNF